MEAGAKPAPETATAPAEPGAPPPGPALTRGWQFSLAALLITLLGLYASSVDFVALVGVLSGLRSVAPEVSLRWALALACLTAVATGALAGIASRRLVFFELLLGCLLFLGTAVPATVYLVWRPFRFSLLPADVVYLVGLMPNPWAGPGLVATLQVVAAVVGLPLGYMARGTGRLSFASAYEWFIAARHLGITPAMLVLVLVLVLTLFLFLVPYYLFRKVFDGLERASIARLARTGPVEAERRLYDAERRRGSPTRTMTTISLCAVALGVAALCVVLSVMSGFEMDLKKKILGTNAHAVVLKYGPDFTEYRAVADKVQKVPGVTGVSPFVLNEVMLSSEQNIAGVLVKGIDPKTVGRVSDLPSNIQPGEGSMEYLVDPSKVPLSQVVPGGPSDVKEALRDLDLVLRERDEAATERRQAGIPESSPPRDEPVAAPKQPEKAEVLPAVLIGRELARSLKVYVGDRVNMVSPLGGELGPQGPMAKSRAFRVGGVFYTGMYEYDSKFAYIAVEEAQKFLGLKDSVTGLELKVRDIDDARKTSRAVLAALDGYPYRTKDWGEMNRNLFSALRLEKLVMGVILAIIVVVACLLILGTLVVLAFEKRKEIAILRSLGAAQASVMKVFILEGTIVGLVGTIVGLIAGVGLCLFVEVVGIRLDPEVYYINRLPVRLDALQYFVVAAISLVLCFLGTIYPALAASEMSPVECLRNE